MWYNEGSKSKGDAGGMKDETVTIPKADYDELLSSNARMADAIRNLEEKVRLLQRARFGASSEKSKYDDGSVQLSMEDVFNEVELCADAAAGAPAPEPDLTKVKAHTRKLHATNPEKLPDDLEVIQEARDIPEAEKICKVCGQEMEQIGADVIRKLSIVPAKLVIREITIPRYICKNCTTEDGPAKVVQALAEHDFLPGSMCTPELAAWIMVQKFVLYSTLYRMEQDFGRQGVALKRQTMSQWVLNASREYLKPVWQLMTKELLRQDICHADETTLQVLHEPGRAPQQKSYMWLFRTGRYAEHPVVIYRYEASRSQEIPKAFLKDFRGYLHADGYAGYHNLPGEISVVGCWAHARRKFDEALTATSAASNASSKAAKGKRYCDAIFRIEDEIRDLSPAEKLRVRKKKAQPILLEFHAWLQSQMLLGKSALGRAVAYTLDQWPYLVNYLRDGRLECSNNRAERSIKPFVMARKNFLFANTPGGAQASAMIFSVIETAKECGLDPYKYLSWLLTEAPKADLQNEACVTALLPWNAPVEACGANGGKAAGEGAAE